MPIHPFGRFGGGGILSSEWSTVSTDSGKGDNGSGTFLITDILVFAVGYVPAEKLRGKMCDKEKKKEKEKADEEQHFEFNLRLFIQLFSITVKCPWHR